MARPLTYQSDKELSDAIEGYFESCWQDIERTTGKNGDTVTTKLRVQIKPYTMSGLALALGISRQTLINYGKSELFFDTVSRAKQVCEVYAEEQLYRTQGSTKGVEFSLKNNYSDWKDKQEVEHSGQLGQALVILCGEYPELAAMLSSRLGLSAAPNVGQLPPPASTTEKGAVTT